MHAWTTIMRCRDGDSLYELCEHGGFYAVHAVVPDTALGFGHVSRFNRYPDSDRREDAVARFQAMAARLGALDGRAPLAVQNVRR
jgi:hypothetical protein